jgi:hypothetical protein
VVPPASIWKKPLPLMARSRPLSVVTMLPCEKRCVTAARFTPMPIGEPLPPPRALAYMSANSAREALAP